MTTPIVDFVRKYNDQKSIRMHMPGHKGKSLLGYEPFDLTEIDGADNLYCPNGIIEESENNASSIFGCDTYYSTEGSSLCIRSMLYIAMTSQKTSTRPVVLAGRNAHKTFISAAALLDFDIEWIYPKDDDVYYSGKISSQDIDDKLSSMHTKPVAVYITTPDYLGNIVDVKSISIVCKKHGVLLLVDNAHGAYLKFLDKSIHPMDLGADICCDSAHKTMNVITGGAYLHVSADMKISKRTIKEAMGLFGSTSPSYLIMQSLDAANSTIDEYKSKLKALENKMFEIKNSLAKIGYTLIGDEFTKITIDSKKYGYLGNEIASILKEENIYCEFVDNDYLVLMLSPYSSDEEIQAVVEALSKINRKEEIKEKAPKTNICKKAMSVREACMSNKITLSLSECLGKVLAETTVSCPPAVPFVVCGEIINEEAICALKYYDIKECTVVK